MGSVKLIRLIVKEFKGDLNSQSTKQIGALHYAAQNYEGFVSLLLLHDEFNRWNGFKFDANTMSGLQASPLHFAVIFREIKNVELLIKYKADVNIKDKEGRTPLHIAVIRLCAAFLKHQEEEEVHGSNGEANLELDEQYLEYKLIIKELLFNGASREVKTNEGATAADILEEHEEIIPPKYYNSLSFILS